MTKKENKYCILDPYFCAVPTLIGAKRKATQAAYVDWDGDLITPCVYRIEDTMVYEGKRQPIIPPAYNFWWFNGKKWGYYANYNPPVKLD